MSGLNTAPSRRRDVGARSGRKRPGLTEDRKTRDLEPKGGGNRPDLGERRRGKTEVESQERVTSEAGVSLKALRPKTKGKRCYCREDGWQDATSDDAPPPPPTPPPPPPPPHPTDAHLSGCRGTEKPSRRPLQVVGRRKPRAARPQNTLASRAPCSHAAEPGPGHDRSGKK